MWVVICSRSVYLLKKKKGKKKKMPRLGATCSCGCFDALWATERSEGGSRTRSGRNWLGWLGQLESFSSPHASIQMLYPVAVAKCFSRHRFLVFFSPYVSRCFPFLCFAQGSGGAFCTGGQSPFPATFTLSTSCASECGIRVMLASPVIPTVRTWWVVAVMIADGL